MTKKIEIFTSFNREENMLNVYPSNIYLGVNYPEEWEPT